jgi:hypothetical protein
MEILTLHLLGKFVILLTEVLIKEICMKLQQTSLDQTGVAILTINNKDIVKPLFSLEPVSEAQELVRLYLKEATIKAVYVTNNLMPTKIEDVIDEYKENHLDLPEGYMEQLLSGFSFIDGFSVFTKSYYA